MPCVATAPKTRTWLKKLLKEEFLQATKVVKYRRLDH